MATFEDKKQKPPGGGPSASPKGSPAPPGGDDFSQLTGPAGDWKSDLLKETSLPPIDRSAEQAVQSALPPPSPPPPSEASSPSAQAPAAPAGAASSAATTVAAGGVSWTVVVVALAIFTVGVVTVGALGSCMIAGILWYAMTPTAPIDPAAEPLIAELASEDAATRERAADGLGAIGSGAHHAIPELKTLLKDNEDTVRYAAAKALANITGWPRRVKRIVSRRLVSRNEWREGDQLKWEELWAFQEKTEWVFPDDKSAPSTP